jgi:hypothetical protein
MINGATQILAGVPGKHLDPLLLAQSQSADAVGFIMIAYQRQLVGDSQPAVRYYDLLFFQGSQIVECARLNQDLRFQLHRDGAIETFRKFGREETTRVFLFLAPDELLHRFRSTFYYEPCLKVQVKALSKKQIVTLLMSTGCQRGIIECNEFTQLAPSIELLEISSPDDIIQYHPKFKHGRILLYDIEKNKELVQERYAVLSQRLVQASPGSAKRDEGRYVLRPSIHIFDSSKARDTGQADPTRDEQEAEEFTEFIKKILNSPMTPGVETKEDQYSDHKGFVITRKEQNEEHTGQDANSISPQAVSPKKSRPPRLPQNSAKLKDKQSEPKANPLEQNTEKSPSQADGLSRSVTGDQTTAATPSVVEEDVQVAAHSDYIKLFERMFRSFRQQMFDCYGDRSEAVIAEAERKVRFLTPEFDLRFLNNETAIVMLDLVETIVDDAPFFKRSRLRDAALTLVADLYNKHYELLENHRAIERVEQCYFRLKR